MSTCLACGSADVTPFLKLPDVPVFCNVLHLADDGRIRDYRIYIDPTPLG